MTPEEAVRSRLLQVSAVTALVASRIWSVKLPQSPTLPAVAVSLVGEITDYHLRGEDHTKSARVQVDTYVQEGAGSWKATVDAIAKAIHGDGAGLGLSGWRGTLGSPPFDVLLVMRLDRQQTYEAAELRVVRIRQDYRVIFRD